MTKLNGYLENVAIWNLFRWLLNFTFGHYRKRSRVLSDWGVFDKSILDIGCGTGQMAKFAKSQYAGLDLSQAYIEACKRTFTAPNFSFKCGDVSQAKTFFSPKHSVLCVGLIHHLSDEQVITLLKDLVGLSSHQVILMDPIAEQSNFLGRWFIRNDRGDYIRPECDYLQIIENSGFSLLSKVYIQLGPVKTIAVRLEHR